MNEKQKRAKEVFEALKAKLEEVEELEIKDGELKKLGHFEEEQIISYSSLPLAMYAMNGEQEFFFSYENESREQETFINGFMS